MGDEGRGDEGEWPDDDDDTSVGECELCRRQKRIKECYDPFAVEGITGDDPEATWWCCRRCYVRRLEDV